MSTKLPMNMVEAKRIHSNIGISIAHLWWKSTLTISILKVSVKDNKNKTNTYCLFPVVLFYGALRK